jgi:hypothetical protein
LQENLVDAGIEAGRFAVERRARLDVDVDLCPRDREVVDDGVLVEDADALI